MTKYSTGVPSRTPQVRYQTCQTVLFHVAKALVTTFCSIFSMDYSTSVQPWKRLSLQRFRGWKILGVCLGVLLFFGIITQADPASAQLFKNVESQVKTIFGSNIDASIISFMFGVLRIVIWVTSVGFILFAVYQAQRGEQWQPLMQNAFIVIAAVVVVEGMSKLFFGTVTGGT